MEEGIRETICLALTSCKSGVLEKCTPNSLEYVIRSPCPTKLRGSPKERWEDHPRVPSPWISKCVCRT